MDVLIIGILLRTVRGLLSNVNYKPFLRFYYKIHAPLHSVLTLEGKEILLFLPFQVATGDKNKGTV